MIKTEIYGANNIGKVLADVAHNVGQTYGPNGGSIAISRIFSGNESEELTKDGVTVLNSLAYADPEWRTICKIVVDAGMRVLKEQGDGTTTVVLLISALYDTAQVLIKQGHRKDKVIAAIKQSVIDTIDRIDHYKRDVETEEQMIQIATLSANGDKRIGEVVGKLAFTLGPNGFINVESNRQDAIYSETKEGYALLSRTQLIAESFMKNDTCIVFDNALVVQVEDNLDSIDQLQGLLQLRSSHKVSQPIIIVAKAIMGSALSTLLTNYHQQGTQIVGVTMPPNTFSDEWEDIRRLLGAKQVFSMTKGVPLIRIIDYVSRSSAKLPEVLGKAKRVSIYRDKIIFEPHSEEIAGEIIKELQERKAQTNNESVNSLLDMRISKLSQAIGIIYVGANTDSEKTRSLAAIDDAQRACFSALKGGIVLGGLSTVFAAAMDVVVEDKVIVKENDNSLYSDFRNSALIMGDPYTIALKRKECFFTENKNLLLPLSKADREIIFDMLGEKPHDEVMAKLAEMNGVARYKDLKLKNLLLYALQKLLQRLMGADINDDGYYLKLLNERKRSPLVLFDPTTGEMVNDGWERGIIEPADVIKSCLKIGSTQAIEFLNTRGILHITD